MRKPNSRASVWYKGPLEARKPSVWVSALHKGLRAKTAGSPQAGWLGGDPRTLGGGPKNRARGPKNCGRGPKNPGRGPEIKRVRKLGTWASVLHRGPHEVGKASGHPQRTRTCTRPRRQKHRHRPRSALCVAAHAYGCTHPTACSVWGSQGCKASLAPDGGRSPSVKA